MTWRAGSVERRGDSTERQAKSTPFRIGIFAAVVMAVMIGVGVCCVEQPTAGAAHPHWADVHSVDHSPAYDTGASHHADKQSAEAVTSQRAQQPTLLQLSDDRADCPEGHQFKVWFSASTDQRRFQPNGRAILLHLSISRT